MPSRQRQRNEFALHKYKIDDAFDWFCHVREFSPLVFVYNQVQLAIKQLIKLAPKLVHAIIPQKCYPYLSS
jgi:hypothetical protein